MNRFRKMFSVALLGAIVLVILRADCSLGVHAEKIVQAGMKKEPEHARVSFQAAIEIFRQLRDQRNEGRTVTLIGITHFYQAQYEDALAMYDRAIAIAKAADDREGEISARSCSAAVYEIQGKLVNALKMYQQLLPLVIKGKFANGEGNIRANLGKIYLQLGQYYQAAHEYQQAVAIFEKQKLDPLRQGEILYSMGIVYARMGRNQEAIDVSENALKIFQAADSHAYKIKTLIALGMMYGDTENGEFQALGNYQQASALLDQAHGEKERDYLEQRCSLNNNIAFVYDALGQKEQNAIYISQARDFYQQSLEDIRAIGDQTIEAKILNHLGEVHLHLSGCAGENRADHLEQAIRYFHEALAIQDAVSDQANIWLTLSNLGRAYELQGKFDDALAYDRQAITRMEELVGAAKIDEYKTSLSDQIAETYQRAILLLMRSNQPERAFEFSERARARVFLDQLGNMRPQNHRQEDNPLFRQEQSLQLEIRDIEQRLAQIHDEKSLPELEKRLNEARQKYAEILLRIKETNPEYASLINIAPLSLKEIQARLDDETTLLSYFVTPEKTLAFIITQQAFNVVELLVSEAALTKFITKFRQQADFPDAFPKPLQNLYAQLIAPIQTYLKTPVIGIVPHGVLHALSFAALTDGQEFLIDRHALFYLPGASALAFLRHKGALEHANIHAIVNPHADGFSDLVYADEEVQAIAARFATTIDATETAFKNSGQYDIVHVASHGEFNAESPLFSRLLLSPDSPRNDGSLNVHEIYDLDFPRTRLAVLSACDTQSGVRNRGDDMVGLHRALMYAGVPSVIASLWKVKDQAAKEVMIAFYDQLAGRKSIAEALQAAQISVRASNPRPSYWASFALTGLP